MLMLDVKLKKKVTQQQAYLLQGFPEAYYFVLSIKHELPHIQWFLKVYINIE